MVASVMTEINSDAYGTVTEIMVVNIVDVMNAMMRPVSVSIVMLCRATTAVTMHDAKSYRSSQSDNKWHSKVMNNYSHLLVAFIMTKYKCTIFTRMVARKSDALTAEGLCEIGASHSWRIPTTLDVYKKHCFVGAGAIAGSCRIVVGHIDMSAVICVAGATFATRTPRAVCQTCKILATRGYTGDWLSSKI